MQVTAEQLEAIERGTPVAIILEHTECVILRREQYEKLKCLLDDSELPPEEAYPAVLEAWDSVGSPDDANDYR